MQPEHHLFILWENARSKEKEISRDLSRRFTIDASLVVHWSQDRVSQNYSRFYGTQLPPGCAKETHCGKGPFRAFLVKDPSPRYETRQTSKGLRSVNVNTFDAKMQYRKWTGGGHRVHATNSVAEAQRDLTLLLGPNWAAEFASSHASKESALHRDLVGANGWSHLTELFAVLNACVRYVVLRNFEILPNEHTTELHGDIDLLTDAYDDLVFIAQGAKVFAEPHRVHFRVPIGGAQVPFDFRYVGDDYYDRQWESGILSRRVLCPRGFYTPSAEDYFYSLLYHALLHKRRIAPDYLPKLRQLARDAGVSCKPHLDSGNPHLLYSVLVPYLERHQYTCPRPGDQSVFFNTATLQGQVQLNAVESGLPLLQPAANLVSARLLAETDGRKYFSYVYRSEDDPLVLKQASADLAWREAQLLQRLSGPGFPRVHGTEQHAEFSVVRLEKIQGEPFGQVSSQIAASPHKLVQFLTGSLDLLEELQTKQITHRDIHAGNVLVMDGHPVLLDFGWAIAPDLPCITPQGLGRDGRPSDGTFCDVYALGKLFEKLVPAANHPLSPLLAVMTAANAPARVGSARALKVLLHSLASAANLQASIPSGITAAPPSQLPNPCVESRLAEAAALYEQGKLEEACATLRAATEIAPHSVAAHVQLAALLVQLDRLDEAEAYSGQALALDGRNLDALQLHAALLQKKEDFTGAIAKHREVLRQRPSDRRTLELLIQCYEDAGFKTLADLTRDELTSLPSQAEPAPLIAAAPAAPNPRAPSADATAQTPAERVLPARIRQLSGDGAKGVSIVIPNFNRKDLSLQCLRSLAALATPVPFEVIFVDNGSQDGSVGTIKRFQKEAAYPIRIVENDRNLGFAKGCNQGALAATHKILLFLNNDTKAAGDFLSRPAALLACPDVGIVGLKLLYPDGLIQHAGIAFDGQKIGTHVFALYPSDYPPANRTREMQAVTGACLFIGKALFEQVGGFDESYVNGQEDLDLCCKVRAAGARVVYCPEAHLIHYESQTAGRLDKALENRKLFLARWSSQIVSDLPELLQLPKRWLHSSSRASKFDLPDRWNIAIKIGVPDRTHRNWGDIMFAESLRAALESSGHRCVIHYLNEWNQEDRHIHVVIHLKGLSSYALKPHHLNVLWIINHPELHTADEINQYDLVLVASRAYSEALRDQVHPPVVFLPQAADVRYMDAEPVNSQSPDIDILFVGNNYEARNGRCRAVIADLRKTSPAGVVKVVGQGWGEFVPQEWILAEFVAPEALPDLYRRAKVVLNDHQETMRQHGFINNRVYDLAMLRVFQISNAVPGLDELGVPSYAEPEQLRQLLDHYLNNAPARSQVADRVYDACRGFTFAERAGEIVRHIRSLAQSNRQQTCRLCGHTGADFLPMGSRPNARCPRCQSLERHRALWHLLCRDEILHPGMTVLEIAPLNNQVFRRFIESKGCIYVCVDKWRQGNPLDARDTSWVDYEMDLCDLRFPDGTFDLVLMQHVIEEIPDDRKAFSEIARVLKPSGTAILEVPHQATSPATEEFGEPRQFGNVRRYGVDFYERLAPYFSWRQELAVDGIAFSVLKGQGQPQPAALPVLLDHPAFQAEAFATRFRDAIRQLRRHDFITLTTAQAANFARGHVHYPRACWLTLDDGRREDLEQALPILSETGCHATSFLISGRITAPDQARWQKVPPAVLDIQSHSRTHRQVFVSGQVVDVYRRQPRYANLVSPETPLGHPIFEYRSGLAARRFIPDPELIAFCLEYFQQHSERPEAEYLSGLQGALQRRFTHHRGTLEPESEYRQRLAHEIQGAKADLEAQFRKPIFAFAFPWGQDNEDSLALVREHYAVALRVIPSRPNLGAPPHQLSRVEISGAAFAEFRKALSRCPPWAQLAFQPAPEVCVLMATYNRRATLAEAIQSVLDQTFTDWNLLVVNDGGEDVADIITQFDDPRIRYLNRPHQGKAAALNAAIEASQSRFIAYLDDDDRFLPNHLEALLSYLRTHPEHQFVHAMAEEISTVCEHGRWIEQSRTIRYFSPVPPSGLRFNNHIPNLCAVHARQLFQQTGLFDETLRVLIDWDMYRRLALASPPVLLNLKTAEYYRRTTPTNRAEGQITGLFATDPARYYRDRLHILRKPGYERFQSSKPAACVVLLTEENKDDLQFIHRFMRIVQESTVELVVIAACGLDEDSLPSIRLAEMIGGMVLWDEDQVGVQVLLQEYLRQPWCRKNLVFHDLTQLTPENVRRGLTASERVREFPTASAKAATSTPTAAAAGQPGGPGISAVVLDNGTSELQRCIARVARWRPIDVPFQLVIGRTAHAAAREENLAALHESWISVIDLPAGESLAAARNRAARAARHECLIFLEPGVKVQHGWAQSLAQSLERHPEAAVSGSKMVFPDGTTALAGVVLVRDEAPGSPLQVYSPQNRLPFHHAEVMRSQACPALTAASFAVRRSEFLRMAGFDEQLDLGYEKVDYCLRARQAGRKLLFEPESVVIEHPPCPVDTAALEEIQKRFNRKWQGRIQPDLIRDRDGKLREPRRVKAAPGPIAPLAAPVQMTRPGQPRVSIVIPVFNRLDLTRQCLTALRAHTPASEYELIVVDNGSTDGTREWLEGEARAGALYLVSNARNTGFAAACNQGAQAAKGDYVLFLNNDTEPQPGWLPPLLDLAERDRSVAAVGSRLLFPDRRIQHAGIGIFHDHLHQDPLQARNLGVGLAADAPAALVTREFQALTAASLLVRKTAFDQAGGFDAGYWNGYEDVDLCFQMRNQGGKLVYQPASVVIHHESQSGPERFSKAQNNVRRLHQKWLRRIQPDFVVGPDGRIRESEAGCIRPYSPAERKDQPARPLASIIILAFNQMADTVQCLESIAAHTSLPHEIIFVDNGSNDGTPEFLRRWQAAHSHVTVVRNSTNRGFAAGNNQALSLAQGENIVLLNNDTVVTPGWLEGMLAVLAQDPTAGLVGPMSNRVSGAQQVPNPGYASLSELPAFAEKWTQSHQGQILEVPRLVGFCLLARRAVIEQIGGLDERFGSGNFEDDDFCIRARLAGFRLHVARSVFIHHTGSQTFQGAGLDYRAAMLRNWDLFKAKWRLDPAQPIEQGYPTPAALPHGVALRFNLPDLDQSHPPEGSSRWRAERQPAAALRSRADRGPAPLPACAHLGSISPAKELFRQKQFERAWKETVAAVQQRPFHPEGCLLLAQIASTVGAGTVARQCAEAARQLAPAWKAARQFLKQKSQGNACPPWLVLPSFIPMGRPRLTVCLITRNEERFVRQCLNSVRGMAQQIVVVDTGSTDRTADIARECGAEVHAFTWIDDFSAARNAALEHATGDWVLMLDADEEVTAEGRAKLEKHLTNPGVIAWRLPLVDAGRETEGASYVPRLFRNAPGLHFVGRVHEQLFHSLESHCQTFGLEHRPGEVQLLHHGYTPELMRDRNKTERNLRLLQAAIAEQPSEPQLHMYLGLELARAGRETEALERYREAFALLQALPPARVSPELRESLLTQLATRLATAKQFDEITQALSSPLARTGGGLTASLHYALGLACLELGQFKQAAEQMHLCLSKRKQRTLAPINSDILTAAPHHCLALCQAQLGNVSAAEKAFQRGLEEPGAGPLRLEYARFLFEQNRPLDALGCLNQAIAQQAGDPSPWRLGGQIALSQPAFLEFACDWTREAVRHLPQDPVLRLQRAEALLLSQDIATAQPLWERLWSDEPRPSTLAALIFCQLAGENATSLPSDPFGNGVTSRAFLDWYRKAVAAGARPSIERINARLERLEQALPEAARMLERVLAEANRLETEADAASPRPDGPADETLLLRDGLAP